MHRLWLIFAQTVTVAVAILFVVSTLKPEWLPRQHAVFALQEVPATADDDKRAPASSYRDAARAALPSVVHIYTTQKIKQQRHPLFDDPIFRHFFGERPEGQAPQNSGLGSGVIVSPNGYILTNFHVVEAADDIQVALNDGKTYKARVIGSDPESDLAVLQIKADKLPTVTFGRTEGLRVGDVVLAIGNPFGVGQTVTMGIVSALGRSHLGINTLRKLHPDRCGHQSGNSGGAWSMSDAIWSASIPPSIPGPAATMASASPLRPPRPQHQEQIIQNGAVTRGWIGVEAQEITAELLNPSACPTRCALIAGVMRGSPAMRPASVRVTSCSR